MIFLYLNPEIIDKIGKIGFKELKIKDTKTNIIDTEKFNLLKETESINIEFSKEEIRNIHYVLVQEVEMINEGFYDDKYNDDEKFKEGEKRINKSAEIFSTLWVENIFN